MHVLLMGSGGREHALAWRILQSPQLSRLSVMDPNPGFPSDVQHVDTDPVDYAVEAMVDLVVIGPEGPLAEGLSDRLREAGIAVFGPSMAAAQLESSKTFAKAFMDRHQIPTAAWSVHTREEEALDRVTGPCVVKANGLAAGKGVLVAEDRDAALAAVREVFSGRFGEAAAQVLIEERLEGPEVSVLALCDGERAIPMLSCRDHKRRFDLDRGPNTGGMGAVCPAPGISADDIEEIRARVLQPVVDGMRAEGVPFRGVLYAGLMWTKDGPKVLEFNVRFGDPECQPLMLMLDEDLLPWLDLSARGRLPQREMQWHSGAACCVVMVADGYPGAVQGGAFINGVSEPSSDKVVFFAGARQVGGHLQTHGGRVLGVTARGNDLEQARRRAYRCVEAIKFEGASWRQDIGQIHSGGGQ